MVQLPAHQDIVYFMEIAKALNISRAAERLGITQPTLTVSLQRLERDIGTPLVLRDKSGVRLTSAGETFLAGARNLLDIWLNLKSQTSKVNLSPSGRYKIGAHPSVALYSWAKILRTICQKYPDIDFEFSHDHSRNITDQVIQSEVDFAVVVNPAQHLDLVLKKIGDDRVEPWVSSKKTYEKSTLIYDPEMLQSQSILSKIRNHNFTQYIHTDNLEVLASLTDEGAGVGLLPGRVAKSGLRFHLKPLSKNSPHFNDSLYFIYRKDRHSTLGSQDLVTSIHHNLMKYLSN
ncbi:MAG: LysR family transcriptional regulator [Bdellovibrionales bacterium]|nr:LysR family transcriptional regulator [Bdellovibrionales bacterium]